MFGSTLFGNSDKDMLQEHIDALSKTTTYKDLCDIVQIKSKRFDIPLTNLLRECILGVMELYSLKQDRKFYQKRKEYSINGTSNPYRVDISYTSPLPVKKITVKYLWGCDYQYSQPAKEFTSYELENISSLLNTSSIYYVDRVDNLEMYFGSQYQNITDGIVNILQLRQPDISNVDLSNYSLKNVDTLDVDIFDLANLISNRLRN